MSNLNVQPVPPPLTTPMHTRSSIEQAQSQKSDQGISTTPWILFWNWIYTTIVNGLPGLGTVTSVSAGTGLSATPGPIVGAGTIKIADTAVTPATYGDSTHVGQFTVDQQGRITAAANVSISGGGGGSFNPALWLPATWNAALGNITAGSGNFTTGVKIVVVSAGKSMKGFNVPWASVGGAKTIKITLWDLGTANTGGSSLGTATGSVNASGLYEIDFSSPISLTQYHFYTLAMYENSGGNYSLLTSTSYRPAPSYPTSSGDAALITDLLFIANDAQPTSAAAGERYAVDPVLV